MINMRFGLSLFPLLCVVLCQCSVTGQVPTHAATTLTQEITRLMNDQLLVSNMQESLKRESFERTVLNATKTIEQLQSNLAGFFHGIFEAVENIQTEMTSLYNESHSFNVTGFSQCCDIKETLEYSAVFKTDIMTDACYRRAGASPQDAYVPISKILTELMKKNRDAYSSVKWQYYGTEDGTISIYPGHEAEDCDDYDPRFRPWYVEAATPTGKDVVIVMDKSTSMKDSNKLNLTKAAATTVINTLNPNDRVAFVRFSTNAYTPANIEGESCYETQMAFATPEVKKHLEKYVNEIKVEGETNYTRALLRAFEMLKTVPNSDRRKVILFLTDGINSGSAENVKKNLKKLNADQKNQVLVLTYGIGDELSNGVGKQLLKDMANMTEYDPTVGERQVGRFELIQDTSQLRTKFGSYYNHFRAEIHSSDPIVTVPYVDFFNLGHIFSVCLSVKHEDRLKGVACVDVLLNDIRQNFDFQEDDTLYAFIIDQTGRTLLHPLLPSPGDHVDADPLFVNIPVLEPEAHKLGIIDSMKRLLEGQIEMKKSMTISRGNALFDGTDEKVVDALYLWKPIPRTKYSVCLVVIPDHVDIELHSGEEIEEYHYHKLQTNTPKPKMCTHNGRETTTDYPTSFLSDKAFTTPPTYKGDEHANTIKNYMQGSDIDSDIFKPDVRWTASVIDKIASQWKSSFKPYILQKYMGTSNGVYTCFPGRELPDEFDHTVNIWYRKAKTNIGKTILHRQADTIRLSQAIITENNDDIAWGVMGMDLKPSFFQNLLENLIESCALSEQFSCFLMDDNGYLLFHPDLDNQSGAGRIPLFQQEPDIANHMREQNILLPTKCTDYAWKEIYQTWRVDVKASPKDNLSEYPHYFFTPIDGTNVYFIMKNTQTSSFKSCKSCTKDTFVSPERCEISSECYCPCIDDADYEYCTNSFPEPEGIQLNLPCLQMEDTKEVLDPDKHSSYPACFDYTCGSLGSECRLYDRCDWCYAHHSSHNMSCQETTVCVYETTTAGPASVASTEESKEKKMNLTKIIVPIVIVLLVAAGLALLFLYKRGCFACSEPDVQPDGLYSDIPPDSKVQIKPHPSVVASPVGFVNNSYGSSEISVIGPGSVTSVLASEQPQYLTNGPMVLVPVATRHPSTGDSSGETPTPELNYAILGSGQTSLSSEYTSPVPSTQSSQPHTNTGNTVPSDGQVSPLSLSPPPESRVNLTPGTVVYMNSPPMGRANSPEEPTVAKAYILTQLSASQLALANPVESPVGPEAGSPVAKKDCNAAEIPPQPCIPPPLPPPDRQPMVIATRQEGERQRPSNDYLTTQNIVKPH